MFDSTKIHILCLPSLAKKVNMPIETKTISARVPVAMHNEIKNYCDVKGISVSDLLRTNYGKADNPGMFDAPDPDANTAKYLISVAGGGLAGVLVYKGVKGILTQKGYFKDDDVKMEMVSIAAAVAACLIAGYSLMKAMKSIK
jgi:hypothetical protein